MSTVRYRWLFVLVAVGAMATVLPGAMAQPPACGFVPTGTLRGTDTFTPDTQSTVVILQPGQLYPVVAVRGDRVNVAVDEAFSAWVDFAGGQLRGDCSAIAAVISATRTPSAVIPQPPTNPAATATCLFVPTGAVTGTDALDSTANTTTATLNAGQPYAVFAIQDGQVNVAVDNGFGVWVDGVAGTLQGACGPFAAPNGVYTLQPELGLNPVNAASCVFVPAEAVIGSNAFTPKTDATVVNLTPGQAYAVLTRTTEQVQITVDGVFNAWVPVVAGDVLGACDILLASTAVALDGARLWSLPDVTTGEVVATIPAQTTLIVIDGPVNGPIRLDTDTTGDWYFVQVGSTAQSGWLWQARLQFTN
ncbi:MAG: hypothetical protein AAFV33_07040 [Chloroflexota bacterium]